MPEKKKLDLRNELSNYLFIFFTVFVLLLSFINIKNITTKKEVKVLGTTVVDNTEFWKDFLKENPTYRDGWVELNRMDIVKRIDPNYPL